MVFGVFLGSAGESFALPECPGSPTSNPYKAKGDIFSSGWSNCVGTVDYSNGSLERGIWVSSRLMGPVPSKVIVLGTNRGGLIKIEIKSGNDVLRSGPSINETIVGKLAPALLQTALESLDGHYARQTA